MKRKLKTPVKILLGILLLIFVIIISFIFIYNLNLSSVSDKLNNEIVEFKIEKGDSIDEIINGLKDNKIIKNISFTKLYIKLNNINNLQAGTYELDNSDNTSKIIDKLNKGLVVNKDEIKITFQEGKTIRGIAKIIENNTNNKEEDVFNLLKDNTYIDSLIEDYWFITEDVKNEELLYPLEGYLAMNTYIYKDKDVTVKEIFKKMLDYMDIILSKYKTQIETSEFSIHEILTFSSIVQSEGLNFDTMSTIAGVFYNRLEENMPFQSCATNCYPRSIEPCTPNKVDFDYDSPYNTYLSSLSGKLPIGPISSFGEDAIKATLTPNDNEYLFFLADKNGKTYFNKTYREHENTISELISKGLWF
ncbi:MAG: endolytic transglycosylase MltG [Bacilli bacterium]|nr:endolytic transglycosylase MltG [Bacilli bacterium]